MECTYQKNMFPGLIYRGTDSPIVLLCFYSGRIVLTGGKPSPPPFPRCLPSDHGRACAGKAVSDISGGWERLWPIVQRFIY